METTFNSHSFSKKKRVLVGKENFHDRLTSHWSASDINSSAFPSGLLTLNSVLCSIFLPSELKKKVVYDRYLSNQIPFGPRDYQYNALDKISIQKHHKSNITFISCHFIPFVCKFCLVL